MRPTKDPKTASERLVEVLPRVDLDGPVVVLDKHIRFTKYAWIDVLGILADLAQRTEMLKAADAWQACKYQPTLGREGFVVRDRGWKGQAVRWLLGGHPEHKPAPLS